MWFAIEIAFKHKIYQHGITLIIIEVILGYTNTRVWSQMWN